MLVTTHLPPPVQVPPQYYQPYGQYPYLTPYAPQASVARPQIASVDPGNVASFGRRAAARAIDCVLIWLAYMVMRIPFTDNNLLVLLFVTPTWLLAWALYESLCVNIAGATVGKKALGIVVVDKRTGALLGFGPALARVAIPVVGALPAYIGTLLVYLSPLFDKSGLLQGWHDKAATDLVVLKSRPNQASDGPLPLL